MSHKMSYLERRLLTLLINLTKIITHSRHSYLREIIAFKIILVKHSVYETTVRECHNVSPQFLAST